MKEKDLMTAMSFYKFSTRAIPEMLVHCQKTPLAFPRFVDFYYYYYF